MLEAWEISQAAIIASTAHAHQRDKHGRAYILHPFRVAMRVYHPLRPAALLHDVVEDTSWTLRDLRKHGFAERTLHIVDLMTRRDGQSHHEYMERLLESEDASLVKLADMLDNTDPRRGPVPGNLGERYRKSIALIEARWPGIRQTII